MGTGRNGKEGYQVIEQKRVDLILSDIMMPNMDGFELPKSVKEHAMFRQIPFMVLKAKDKPVDVDTGPKLSVDDTLGKRLVR
jgi:CheY-like chemotaxis protein